MGFFKKLTNVLGGGGGESAIGNILGGPIGGIATNAVGGLITDARERKNRSDKFDFLQSKGLNAFEAAGAGGANTSSPGTSTLGNGPQRTLARQQSFQRKERAKDRAVEIYKADQTAKIGQRNVVVTERKEERSQDLHQMEQQKMTHQIRLLNTQAEQANFNLTNAWALKIAGMSRENVMASLAAYNMAAQGGPTFKEILTATGFTAEKIRLAEQLTNKLVGQGGHTQKEMLGISNLMKLGVRGTNQVIKNVGTTLRSNRYKSEWKRQQKGRGPIRPIENTLGKS